MCPLCGMFSVHAHTEPEVERLRRQILETLEDWWAVDA